MQCIKQEIHVDPISSKAILRNLLVKKESCHLLLSTVVTGNLCPWGDVITTPVIVLQARTFWENIYRTMCFFSASMWRGTQRQPPTTPYNTSQLVTLSRVIWKSGASSALSYRERPDVCLETSCLSWHSIHTQMGTHQQLCMLVSMDMSMHE